MKPLELEVLIELEIQKTVAPIIKQITEVILPGVERLKAERDTDQSALAEAVALLRGLQWSDHRPSGIHQCPVCCNEWREHTDNCELAAFLARHAEPPTGKEAET